MAKPRKIKKVSPDDPAMDAAIRILRVRLKEFYSHWPDPDRMPTFGELHDTRISGKRLRYSAESLRALYPDKLALLIELLKRSQDLLGEIQDCLTQRRMIEGDLIRLRRRKPKSDDIAVFEEIISNYEQRQDLLFIQFREVWRGMTLQEFRDCLKAMVVNPEIRRKESDDTPFHLITPY